MKPIEIRMPRRSETKGTFRYDAEDPDAAVTALYIRKAAFAGDKAPEAILVTVVADA